MATGPCGFCGNQRPYEDPIPPCPHCGHPNRTMMKQYVRLRLIREIRPPFRKEREVVGAFEPPPASSELSREDERAWWEAYVERRIGEERTRGVIGGLVAGATLIGTYHSGWLTFGPVLAFWIGVWYLYFYEGRNRFWSAIAWILMAPVLAVIALLYVGRSCSGEGP